MGFSASWTMCLLLVSLVLVQASTDSDQIQKALNDMVTLSNTLQTEAEEVTRLTVDEDAPKIVDAVNALNTRMGDITYYINQMQTPLSDDDAKSVLSSVSSFDEAQAETLDTLAELPSRLFPFFGPSGNQEKVRLALVTLDTATKSLACELVGVVPSQRGAAKEQFNSIADSVRRAVGAYSSGPDALAL